MRHSSGGRGYLAGGVAPSRWPDYAAVEEEVLAVLITKRVNEAVAASAGCLEQTRSSCRSVHSLAKGGDARYIAK